MGEVYNFSKNVNQIVAPTLKQMGFRKKDTRFLREKNELTEEIYFQRSQWNSKYILPCEFYLDYSVYDLNGKAIIYYERLHPTRTPIPAFYKEFNNLSPDKRNEVYERYSESERKEIKDYWRKNSWYYSSEEELKEILFEAKTNIIEKGIKIFDFVQSNFEQIKNERTKVDFEERLRILIDELNIYKMAYKSE